MTRRYFSDGSRITWVQYKSKDDARNTILGKLGEVRTGIVWAQAPKFDGVAGAHVWVIPDDRRPNENSAIAVRVHMSGDRRGEAEVFEDSGSYRGHSLKG